MTVTQNKSQSALSFANLKVHRYIADGKAVML